MQKPIINYDTSSLEEEGYKYSGYALNPKNPVYQKVIEELEKQNILYKTIPVENNQNHIWIKEN